ncbi:MAG: cob(I)yrinic acid a,c-diamide adenosyltransferase [Planctomycetes bacterium]|nr:cob(I)yrinic acid a,c-diamide adenosyltransferase [Planctomycetota bacterium]
MTGKARILIFTGEGKGKTTAALGMAFRASGHGLRILVIQFVKESDTGEIFAANTMANMKIVQTGLGFLPDAKSEEYCKHKLAAEEGLALAAESIESGNYDLIILDEVCVAVNKGLLQERDIIEVIDKTNENMSLVLTGRYATDGLINIADTVSNIECVKHGLDAGILAQKGVEF